MRMHRCGRCRRHIRLEESRCPFCSSETVARTTVTALTIGSALTGCTGREVPPQDDTTSDGTTTTSVSTTDVSSTLVTSSPTGTTTSVSATADSSATLDSGDDLDDESTYDDGWDTCIGFYGCPPDGGGNMQIECDVWSQDCPEGEKCMPWANDGTSVWNATRCSPLDPDPGQPGEPCTVEGSGVSGIDDCDIGSMCWRVDGETNQGECVDFCIGSEANPACEDAALGCVIRNDGVLILCLPPCDPLLLGCEPGDGCYPDPYSGVFYCMPDASAESGAHGDACDYIDDCDPGLVCAQPTSVAGCIDAGCCTEVCDVTLDFPDAACSGAADGETCVAFYEDGDAPAGLDHLGVCVLPEA